MPKGHTVVKGIVLRSVDTKESDKILTVLTEGMGKIPVVAKGARSRRSKVTAAVQLLAYSELVLSESHGWQYLTEASTIELFDGVRQDIALFHGSPADPVSDRCTARSHGHGRLSRDRPR